MTNEKAARRLGRGEWQPSAKEWEILKPLARQMRMNPTAAENRMWQRIRRRQVRGAKFRRQSAIDRYIVDFCCPSLRLVIEIDGPIHEQTQEQDAIRQTILESLGFRVLRFTNCDVLNDIETVAAEIGHVVADLTPPPALPGSGRGLFPPQTGEG